MDLTLRWSKTHSFFKFLELFRDHDRIVKQVYNFLYVCEGSNIGPPMFKA